MSGSRVKALRALFRERAGRSVRRSERVREGLGGWLGPVRQVDELRVLKNAYRADLRSGGLRHARHS